MFKESFLRVFFKGRGKVTKEELVMASQNGDDEAFYLLIDANKEKLYRISFSYLRNEGDSVEAIQEVTYKAYTQIKKLKEPKYFDTWLIRILINYCLNELKRRKRTIFKIIELKTVEDNTERLSVEEALETLDQKYQTIIILKYFNDLTIHEIAEIMNRPEGTIKTWLHNALLKLRLYFGKDGEMINVQ